MKGNPLPLPSRACWLGWIADVKGGGAWRVRREEEESGGAEKFHPRERRRGGRRSPCQVLALNRSSFRGGSILGHSTKKEVTLDFCRPPSVYRD